MTPISEPNRVGVFVCHCGVNIGSIVDVPSVVEFAKTLPEVAYVEENMYLCSEAGLESIKDAITKHCLNKVVIAACTPRTHETLLKETCQEAGINPYLLEIANIREQCSWVHLDEPKKATEKAKNIVRMAVEKVRLLEPLEEPEIGVKDSVLVIGGGVSGLTAALSLANQSINVFLIEKEADVGGVARTLNEVYPTFQKASDVMEPLIDAAKAHKNIKIFASTTLKDIKGFAGNFHVTALKEKTPLELEAGAIIVACGAWNYEPAKGMYQYGVHKGVVRHLELEKMLREGTLKKPERVVMIQCVGSRTGELWGHEIPSLVQSDAARLLTKLLAKKEEGWPHCSKICCMNSVKNAILIKKLYPDADVCILYSDLRTYKGYEDFYAKARDLEVRFIKYELETKPKVTQQPDGKLKVTVYEPLAGREIDFISDLVVLATPLIPSKEGILLSRMLKVPLAPDGFFMEAHPKVRPVGAHSEGVFVVGTASGPRDIPESIASAKAAAAKVSTFISKGKFRTEGIIATVDSDLCIGCGLCEELCPYGAAKIEEAKSVIIKVLCRGCGICAAECPEQAITMRHFTDKQILAQIKAALAG
ncbi:MAG: CoB--CoM heterodisulfide reductase iron-sulfur subunit A family protein [Candidatus Bathyarchaeota archaeon]|nr:CoB--CoM heterodisulfide reductase iron-sulfur subunit A family protein [Candidatus Bathyarchaeota archaeon]